MVPFEQLGDGQVGRLVYQVIGQDGPIFNPRNLSYLSPDIAQSTSFSLSEIGAGLAGLNLAASVGVLAISAVTLREIGRLHEKVDKLLQVSTETKKQVEEIASRVERIDMRVAENNLREAMRHVLKDSVHSDAIDLGKLLTLRTDIQNFYEALDAPAYFNFGLRFASDVRANLNSIYSLLLSTRLLVACRHNSKVPNQPGRMVTPRPSAELTDLLEVGADLRAAAAFSQCVDMYASAQAAIVDSVNTRFTFSGQEDFDHFSTVLNEKLATPLEQIFQVAFPGGKAIYNSLPKDTFEGSVEEVQGRLIEIADLWASGTDSALLMRTELELNALENGYENVFWPHLKEFPAAEIGPITVASNLGEQNLN